MTPEIIQLSSYIARDVSLISIVASAVYVSSPAALSFTVVSSITKQLLLSSIISME